MKHKDFSGQTQEASWRWGSALGCKSTHTPCVCIPDNVDPNTSKAATLCRLVTRAATWDFMVFKLAILPSYLLMFPFKMTVKCMFTRYATEQRLQFSAWKRRNTRSSVAAHFHLDEDVKTCIQLWAMKPSHQSYEKQKMTTYCMGCHIKLHNDWAIILSNGQFRYLAMCLAVLSCKLNPYPTAFPYENGMVLHFYQQQESSTTKTVHKVINKGLKTYV